MQTSRIICIVEPLDDDHSTGGRKAKPAEAKLCSNDASICPGKGSAVSLEI